MVALVASLQFLASAEDTVEKLPPDCAALKKQYLRDTENATKPIRARYVSALQALVAAATRKGDLAGALTIQNELTHLILVGRWQFHSVGSTSIKELHSNGTFTTEGKSDSTGTWVLEPNGLVLRYSTGGNETFPGTLNPNGTKGHSTSNFDLTITKLPE